MILPILTVSNWLTFAMIAIVIAVCLLATYHYGRKR